jgi:hypothetical protein
MFYISQNFQENLIFYFSFLNQITNIILSLTFFIWGGILVDGLFKINLYPNFETN